MKTKFLFFSVLLFTACNPKEQTDTKTISTETAYREQTDTAISAIAITDSASLLPSEDLTIEEQMQECFVVIAGSSNNFSTLNKTALNLSKKTKMEYDNSSLVYDKKRGMIVPDTSSDEIYAGVYYPRRYDENKISIEMLWYYQDEQNDTLKDMVIIAGIHGNKEEAEQQLQLIKAFVPDSYILKRKIYMSCMH